MNFRVRAGAAGSHVESAGEGGGEAWGQGLRAPGGAASAARRAAFLFSWYALVFALTWGALAVLDVGQDWAAWMAEQVSR